MSQTQINRSIPESGDVRMKTNDWHETFVERKVTYTIEVDGKFIIIENVPARVCLETGERLFAPETVERLQQTVWGERKPDRVIETPVFEFAA
jgi:YgiT-type zinc finger domain-containing protein